MANIQRDLDLMQQLIKQFVFHCVGKKIVKLKRYVINNPDDSLARDELSEAREIIRDHIAESSLFIIDKELIPDDSERAAFEESLKLYALSFCQTSY